MNARSLLFLVGLLCVPATGAQADSGEGHALPPVWDTAYTAYGIRESWRIVAQEKTMLADLFLNGRQRDVTLRSHRSEDAEKVRYSGTDRGRPVVLEIRREPCHSESEDTDFSAVLIYDGLAMPGCAVSGAIEYAPT